MVEIDSIKIRLSSRKNTITMDIAEARELHRQLDKLFGGGRVTLDTTHIGPNQSGCEPLVSGSMCGAEAPDPLGR